MHERAKLKEARHFLARMYREHGDPAAFTHEHSAFLGAARSVLQYAHKEVRANPSGLNWYNQAMSSPLLCFFKDLRDESVHRVPVRLRTKTKIVVSGLLNIGDEDEEMLIPYPHHTSVHHYEFQARPGEDVMDLSQQYFKALADLVEDGIAKGWITG